MDKIHDLSLYSDHDPSLRHLQGSMVASLSLPITVVQHSLEISPDEITCYEEEGRRYVDVGVPNGGTSNSWRIASCRFFHRGRKNYRLHRGWVRWNIQKFPNTFSLQPTNILRRIGSHFLQEEDLLKRTGPHVNPIAFSAQRHNSTTTQPTKGNTMPNN